jgi:PAN domain
VRKLQYFMLLSLIVFAACFRGLAAASAQEQCRVADVLGTPSNVSLTPNGRIVGIVPSGALVRIIDRSSQNGKNWVYIELVTTQIRLGWVLRDYLSCDHTPESAQQAAKGDQPIDGYAFEYRNELANTVSGLEECIASCQSGGNCNAYVYFKSKTLCRLMTRTDAALLPNSDAVSGYILAKPR